MTNTETRLRFLEAAPTETQSLLCRAVLEGMSKPQKELPSRYFYDETGSALFEQICAVPEYYPTRTEQAIFEAYAAEMIAVAAPPSDALTLIEFGSGSSRKTRLLLDAAFVGRQFLHYLPIDISTDFLRASCQTLLADYPALRITALAAEYNEGIALLPTALSDDPAPRLFIFMGSNIGNFEDAEAVAFLARVRLGMRPQDRLLLGADRLKSVAILEAAYDDAAGVTARFNKNLLARVNRELGADFDLAAFDHAAPFVPAKSRIEMHLISRKPQVVEFRALEQSFAFREGESIHTENSHKYSPAALETLAAASGLQIEAHWTDAQEWFSVLLLKPQAEES